MSELLLESLSMLNVFGSHPETATKITNRVKCFTSLFFCASLCLMLIQYCYTHWSGVDTAGEFADSFTTAYQVFWKYICVIFNRKLLLQSFETVKTFRINKEEPGSELHRVIDDLHGLTRKFFRGYAKTIIIGGVMFDLKPLLYWQRMQPGYFTLYCDNDKDVCFVVSYMYHICATVVLCGFMIGTDGVFFSLVSYAYIELEAIKYGLTNLKIDENIVGEQEAVLEEFKKLVKHHIVVLNFMGEIDKIFQHALLHQFAAAIFAICCGIFVMNLGGFPPQFIQVGRYIVLLLAFPLQLLAVCVAGEFLMNQALSVADVAYDASWHVKHQPKLTKGLTLVIQRTTKLQQLKIGAVWNLNLATFVVVVKTSVSVFAFMQTVYEFD